MRFGGAPGEIDSSLSQGLRLQTAARGPDALFQNDRQLGQSDGGASGTNTRSMTQSARLANSIDDREIILSFARAPSHALAGANALGVSWSRQKV